MIHRDDPWKKSLHSDATGACLEVRLRSELQIRTSSDLTLSPVKISCAAWARFISAIQADSPLRFGPDQEDVISESPKRIERFIPSA
ncbi:DUF397 domain-containing protein [Streptomyces sp. NPDC055210]